MSRTSHAAILANALRVEPHHVRATQELQASDPDTMRALVAAVRAATMADDPDVASVAALAVARYYRPETGAEGTVKAVRAAVKHARRILAGLAVETYGAPADLADDTRTMVARAATPDPQARYSFGAVDLVETVRGYVADHGSFDLGRRIGEARQGMATMEDVRASADAAPVLPRPEYLQSLTDGGTGYTAHPPHTRVTRGDVTPRQGSMPSTVTVRTRDGRIITRDLTEWEADLQAGRLDRNGYPRHLGYGEGKPEHDDTGNTDPGHAWRTMAATGTPVPSGKVPVSPRKRAGGSTGPTVPARLSR